MSRGSSDQLAEDGTILNGYDYNMQVWVVDGLIVDCGHPKDWLPYCCNSRKYAGQKIKDVPGHEVRPLITEGRTIWNSDGTDGPAPICVPPKRKES